MRLWTFLTKKIVFIVQNFRMFVLGAILVFPTSIIMDNLGNWDP